MGVLAHALDSLAADSQTSKFMAFPLPLWELNGCRFVRKRSHGGRCGGCAAARVFGQRPRSSVKNTRGDAAARRCHHPTPANKREN